MGTNGMNLLKMLAYELHKSLWKTAFVAKSLVVLAIPHVATAAVVAIVLTLVAKGAIRVLLFKGWGELLKELTELAKNPGELVQYGVIFGVPVLIVAMFFRMKTRKKTLRPKEDKK